MSQFRRHFATTMLLCFVGLSFNGGSLRAENPEEANTIGRKLGEITQASTFLELLKNTDKTKQRLFDIEATTTVFVPTNAAFEALDPARRAALTDPSNKHYLERVLSYHATHDERIDRYILTRVGLIPNGVGQFLTIDQSSDGTTTVQGAQILEGDLACSNGVVHFIDTVLDPVELDLFETLEQDGRFTILTRLIKRSGLTKLFQNRHTNYTIFAPTDSAFASLPAGTVESLLTPAKLDLLSDVIRTHITDNVFTISKIPGLRPLGTPGLNITNEYEQTLIYRLDGSQPTIDGRTILEADRVARNGILHVIDRPLMPKRDSILTVLEERGGFEIFLSLLSEAGVRDLLGQFNQKVTVFAPTDEALGAPEIQSLLAEIRRPANRERLRGLLLRHITKGQFFLTNAIAYRRFTSDLGGRIDFVRDGDRREAQGVAIVETDILARNGVVHGVDGFFPEQLDLPDQDQTWSVYRRFVFDTLIEGSRLYESQRFFEATEYFARRGYEFKVRYNTNLYRIYSVNANSFLNEDRMRNRSYDFATTAWTQRNGFVGLLRELEEVAPRIIDEIELDRGRMTETITALGSEDE